MASAVATDKATSRHSARHVAIVLETRQVASRESRCGYPEGDVRCAPYARLSPLCTAYKADIKATRSFFSGSLSLSSRIRLKNSTVSSSVSSRPSCR